MLGPLRLLRGRRTLWPGRWNVEDRDRVVPTAPWNLIREAERVSLADISRICQSTKVSSWSFFFSSSSLASFVSASPASRGSAQEGTRKTSSRTPRYRVLRVWIFCIGSTKRCESRGVSMSLTSAYSRCIMADDEERCHLFLSASCAIFPLLPWHSDDCRKNVFRYLYSRHACACFARRREKGRSSCENDGSTSCLLDGCYVNMVLQYLDVSRVRVLLNGKDERLIAYVLFYE